MRKLPFWKIKRELKRVLSQAKGMPGSLADDYLSGEKYEFDPDAILKTEGQVSASTEACIFLIYPDQGILPSHLQVLGQMKAEGIFPVLVSNLPLTEAQRAMLGPHCGLIFERPNAGYDFGGYRDAVLLIEDMLGQLDRLFILNDSVWMIPSAPSWFAQARAAGQQFVGATSNYGNAKRAYDSDPDAPWTYSSSYPSFHYASYALMFDSSILRSESFMQYWRKIRLSDDKKKTVRRGEIGLTQQLMSEGFSHGATCGSEALDAELATLESDVLKEIVEKIVIPEAARLEKRRLAFIKAPHSRAEYVAFALTVVSYQAIIYSMPFYTIGFKEFQFLKKSPLWLSRGGSDNMLKIIETLPPADRDLIAPEAQALRSRLTDPPAAEELSYDK
jgi:hypothetical protein